MSSVTCNCTTINQYCISEPIRMTWNITASPAYTSIDSNHSIEFRPIGNHTHEAQLPVLRDSTPEHKYVPINCDENNIIRVLKQYNPHNDYRKYSGILMHGFIREAQQQTTVIPSEIIDLCLLFYFEEANNCIHLAYDLFQMIEQKVKKECFAGQMLMSMITENGLHTKYKMNVTEMFTDLVRHKFMKIVSCRSSFSALLNAKSDDCIFSNDPDRCTYKFMQEVKKAFHEHYMNSIESTQSQLM